MLPETIDFRVTPECNLCCPFCFGTKEGSTSDISLQLDFLQKLWDAGVKNIVITGGEPTLHPDFVHLLKTLKAIGYHIALSTNGTFWDREEIREAVLECVSCISLPLESAEGRVHNALRRGEAGHFERIIRTLGDLRDSRAGIQVRISTVVMKDNLDTLGRIPEILPFRPDIWKLYQLSRCDHNSAFHAEQKVSDECFRECIETLKRQYAELPTRIVGAFERDRAGKYLFLEPNGVLKTIADGREYVIGHISDNAPELYAKIERIVDSGKINANFYESFT